jgi:molybdopterin converting factor small subunit
MVGVQLEVLPGLSECVGGKGNADSVFFNKEMEAGSTVGDVIRKLAAEHKAFGDIILDSQTNELRGGVALAINGLLLDPVCGLGARIKDGDVIKLVPLLVGG